MGHLSKKFTQFWVLGKKKLADPLKKREKIKKHRYFFKETGFSVNN
jgi:hypothetical protein